MEAAYHAHETIWKVTFSHLNIVEKYNFVKEKLEKSDTFNMSVLKRSCLFVDIELGDGAYLKTYADGCVDGNCRCRSWTFR